MLYETTSHDVKMKIYPLQDVFVISSREEISKSETLERLFSSFRGKTFEKPLFTIPNLSPILQIDYSSSMHPFLEFRSETVLTEESFRKVEQREVLEYASRIFDKLVLEENFLRKIEKKPLLNTILEILNKIPIEQMEISEDELFKRIRRVVVLEAVTGIVNELNPEEIKDFDEMVKRRPLFK